MLTVSIINYRSHRDTADCIRELAELCRGIEYRVVVLDNSEISQIQDLQRELRDITVPLMCFASPKNSGFAAGHNLNFKSVLHGEGDVFLILNPDIHFSDPQVIPAMLAALSTMRLVSCVIETAKTGEVWFSGGRIGRVTGMPAIDRTRFSEASRTVDFVTGCCMMISTDLFGRLGGFDESYFMYSEDVDLCLRAKQLSAEAVVVNRTIVHQIGSGEKGSYSDLYLYEGTRNRLLCLRRHRLGSHFVGIVYSTLKYGVLRSLQLAIRSRHPFHQIAVTWRGMMDGLFTETGDRVSPLTKKSEFAISAEDGLSIVKRSLLIVPYSPNPVRVRALELLAHLMRSTEVDLLCLDDGNPIRLPDGVRRLTVIPNASKLTRVFRILFGLARRLPIGQEFYNSLQLPRILAGIDLSQYDVIVVKQLPLHRLNLNHPRIVYDIEDCWSHKSAVMAESVKGIQRFLYAIDRVFTPPQEVAACNRADVILVTAEREANRLRLLGVTKPIEVFVHGHTCPLPPRTLVRHERLVLSFHGKLSYKPNEIALGILNDLVTPRLDQDCYDLRIIGPYPSAYRSKFPALHFTGYVESIADALSDSDLSVFPLTISVGFPNKAMESLADGVPFIATPGVIEGLPPMPELLEHGVYVREIDEFVPEIERFRRLDMAERRNIAQNCRDYVERVYSPAQADLQWSRILATTGPGWKDFESAPIEDSVLA
jgi:GT2 family glycosyltransferase